MTEKEIKWHHLAIKPSLPGSYHVMRAWADEIQSYGHCWFDGQEWIEHTFMNEAVGPIIYWTYMGNEEHIKEENR